MIVVSLRGGLGNQLFQYAAARRLSIVRGVPLRLDLDWYRNTPRSNTKREYELRHYGISAAPVNPVEARWCRLHHGRVTRRLPFLPRRWRHYRESGFEFEPDVLSLASDVYLDGYWQSFLYFSDIRDTLRAELTLQQSLSREANQLAAEIVSAAYTPVSVHIRRGDYVTHPSAASMHGVCSVDYYADALGLMAARVENLKFFVFSDDISWARANLQFPGAAQFIDYESPCRVVEDLYLMSQCEHHVISNSSFSWWGAWLSGATDGCVLAPKRWFADGRSTESLVPKAWHRL